MDVTSILTGGCLLALGTLLTPLVARLVPKADAYARTEGAVLGHTLVSTTLDVVPAGLRDFVKSQLQMLAAAQAENAQVTVTDAVDRILAAAQFRFPGVTAQQIAQIAGDFVFAVVAGVRGG